jgi:transcriptional regulator with XRE-family HTH domain
MGMIDKLLGLIADRGFSKDEFEKRAGLSHGRIGKWENGTGEPTAAQALAMAKLLGVPVVYLIDDAQESPDRGLTPDEQNFLALYRMARDGKLTEFADYLRDVSQAGRYAGDPPLTSKQPPLVETEPGEAPAGSKRTA